jgi:hypothetical protein
LKQEWIKVYSNLKKLPNDFPKDAKSLPDDERAIVFYGSRIRDHAERCRTEINNRMVPFWKDPSQLNDEEDETTEGMLYAVRERYLAIHSIIIAKDLYSKYKNNKIKEDYIQSKLNAFYEKWKLAKGLMFPEDWLTFLLLSKPAGDNMFPGFNGSGIKPMLKKDRNSLDGSFLSPTSKLNYALDENSSNGGTSNKKKSSSSSSSSSGGLSGAAKRKYDEVEYLQLAIASVEKRQKILVKK